MRQQFKLPRERPLEGHQQSGWRSAILILFCATHLEAIWQISPDRDVMTDDALREAIEHFAIDRDPGLDGGCHPGLTFGWDFDIDFRYRYDYRDSYQAAEAADKAAEEAAAEVEVADSVKAAASETEAGDGE